MVVARGCYLTRYVPGWNGDDDVVRRRDEADGRSSEP